MKPKRAGGAGFPDWIRHEHDGGFVAADWMEPADFALDDPGLAESAARRRWIASRNAWLADRPDVADVLMGQLRAIVGGVP